MRMEIETFNMQSDPWGFNKKYVEEKVKNKFMFNLSLCVVSQEML